jgi:acetolactate synthase small subunit
MKKSPKKLDLHHNTVRPLGCLELARAGGGAMMAYAISNPVPPVGTPVIK